MTIGQRLRELRKKRDGMTLDALSVAIGVTRSALSQTENDQTKPSADILIKLSDFYDVSCDYILRGKEYTPNITYQSNNSSSNINSIDDFSNIIKTLSDIIEKDRQTIKEYADKVINAHEKTMEIQEKYYECVLQNKTRE